MVWQCLPLGPGQHRLWPWFWQSSYAWPHVGSRCAPAPCEARASAAAVVAPRSARIELRCIVSKCAGRAESERDLAFCKSSEWCLIRVWGRTSERECCEVRLLACPRCLLRACFICFLARPLPGAFWACWLCIARSAGNAASPRRTRIGGITEYAARVLLCC
jgi:hypothetical protein